MHVEPRKICPGHFPDPNIDDVIMMIMHAMHDSIAKVLHVDSVTNIATFPETM
jgi:hypothetical protein